MRQSNISTMIKIAIMAALISVLSYVTVPLPPVPITGQTLGIMLTGLILSPINAAISVLIFILLGAIGIPVFSGGQAGLPVLVGPTGGYIVGFLIGAIVISLLKKDGKSFTINAIASIIGGVIVVYCIGVPWLAKSLALPLKTALITGVGQFLIGDLIKVVLASYIAVQINKALH